MKQVVEHTKRVIRIVTAVVLIVVAALLGFVPGIPGWPLALAGLSLLAVDFVWAHRLKMKLKDGAGKLYDKVRGKKSD
jgi:hypothetical protein